jgi:hypothetical protein
MYILHCYIESTLGVGGFSQIRGGKSFRRDARAEIFVGSPHRRRRIAL